MGTGRDQITCYPIEQVGKAKEKQANKVNSKREKRKKKVEIF